MNIAWVSDKRFPNKTGLLSSSVESSPVGLKQYCRWPMGVLPLAVDGTPFLNYFLSISFSNSFTAVLN